MRRHNKDFFFLVKEERKSILKDEKKDEKKDLFLPKSRRYSPSCLIVPYGFRKVRRCEIQVSNRPKNTLRKIYLVFTCMLKHQKWGAFSK
jgi:hypothetical protein